MLLEAIFIIATVVSGFIVSFYYFVFNKREINSQSPPLIVRFAKGLLPSLVVILIIRSFVCEGFRIPSESMQPTLIPGDVVIVDKYSYGLRMPFFGTKISNGKPDRGDIVVFKGELDGHATGFIKRIVGLPGDHISYQDRILYVNNKPAIQTNIRNYIQHFADGEHLKTVRATELLDTRAHDVQFSWEQTETKHQYSDLIVPDSAYYVIGDYRDDSSDSRDIGVIMDDRLVGKARAIVFSIDWPAMHPRWHRISSLKQAAES